MRMTGQASEVEREVERERGEKVPNTRKTRAPYFCKSGFIRKARVVRRDVELPELPILYKKTFTARGECVTHRGNTHIHAHTLQIYIAHIWQNTYYTHVPVPTSTPIRGIFIYLHVFGEDIARPFFRYTAGHSAKNGIFTHVFVLTRRRGISLRESEEVPCHQIVPCHRISAVRFFFIYSSNLVCSRNYVISKVFVRRK